MIEKLVLTNFRKHEDLVLDFVAGLNVVRGSNEAGKSTLQEAIGYALFGSKALRTNFADTVTWGRPESTLKVALTLILGERKLTFARGKSGAEVLEDGRVIVTGQNEVSTYAANLLSCDGTAAANLMIASQNAMRGSLEQGPKATAAMIEQLADFDLFDTLLERIQTQLVVGAPATFEQRVADAQTQLDAFVPAPKPDDAGHTTWLTTNAVAVGDLRGMIDNKLQPAYRAAEKARDDVVALTKACDEAADELVRAEKTLSDHTAQRDQFKAAVTPIDAAALASARHMLGQAELAAGAAESYKLFKALPTCAHEFEGDNEAFASWLDERREAKLQAHTARAECRTRHTVLEAGIVIASACGFCGQDVSAFPEVAQKNKAAREEMVKLSAESETLQALIDSIEAEIDAGGAINTTAVKIQQTLSKLSGLVSVDTAFTPPQVSWIGQPPSAVDTAPAKALVVGLEREAEQSRNMEAKADVMAEVLIEDSAAVERARAKAAHYQRPADPGALHQTYIDAQQAFWDAESKLQVLKNALDDKRDEYNNTVAVFNARKGEHDRLHAAVVKAQADLEDLAFNNTLQKKVRAARPIIADKLWNTVLAAVSTMFSQMRGEPGVVSKDSGGFKVNGQPIEALSGSTLDILGKAIRVALVKTFIPHADFMLLDEPFSAMDEGRTLSALAFIQSAGISQVILATHEDISGSLSDHVIQI